MEPASAPTPEAEIARLREAVVDLERRLEAARALAASGAELHAEVVRRQREYEELARVARLVNETLDLTTVGERIADSVLGLLGVRASALRLLQPDGALNAIALGGRAKEYAGNHDVVPAGVGLIGRAAVEGRPMWTPDIRSDARFELNPEEAPVALAEAALRPLRDLLGIPRAIVNLFDLEAGEVEWLAAVGRRRIYTGPGVRYPLRLAGDLEALRRGEPQVIDVDALPPSAEAEALLASGVHEYMVVPMIVGGELIGSVSFGGDRGQQFPPEQVSIAQEVATQLAIAIAQARLHERVKRQAAELEVRVQERTR